MQSSLLLPCYLSLSLSILFLLTLQSLSLFSLKLPPTLFVSLLDLSFCISKCMLLWFWFCLSVVRPVHLCPSPPSPSVLMVAGKGHMINEWQTNQRALGYSFITTLLRWGHAWHGQKTVSPFWIILNYISVESMHCIKARAQRETLYKNGDNGGRECWNERLRSQKLSKKDTIRKSE